MPSVSNNSGYNANLGVFKDAWADGITETYAAEVPILASMPFTEREAVGGQYHVPTRVSLAGGFTFAPSSSVSGGEIVPGTGSRPYVGPNPSVVLDARIDGMQMFGRGRVTYEAIARTARDVNSRQTDPKKAVREATMTEFDGLNIGGLKKLEALMLHGQRGLGQIELISNVVASQLDINGVSGFAVDVQISQATWIEALWLASERHGFDVFASSGGLPTGARLNTTTNTVWDGVFQTGFELVAVAPPSNLAGATFTATDRVLRLWHSSGTAGVPGTGVIGGWTTSASPTQVLCFESAGSAASGFNEFVGLSAIASNTGTMFNISGATYSMWHGNVVSSVGPTKLSELIRYASRAINAGAKGKRMRAVVPTEMFAQFGNDEAALRRYDGRATTGQGGMVNIECYLPMGGVLEVLGHNLQKAGEVLIYPPGDGMRVGAQDLDFVLGSDGRSKSIRSMKDADFAMEVNDMPAKEVRLYANFAPYMATPRHMTLLTGVTY